MEMVDLNPQHFVCKTNALPVKLHPLFSPYRFEPMPMNSKTITLPIKLKGQFNKLAGVGIELLKWNYEPH
jgi:hypothetical protein